MGTLLTDTGISYLENLIAHLLKLENLELYISKTKISDPGLLQLAMIIDEKLTKLQN